MTIKKLQVTAANFDFRTQSRSRPHSIASRTATGTTVTRTGTGTTTPNTRPVGSPTIPIATMENPPVNNMDLLNVSSTSPTRDNDEIEIVGEPKINTANVVDVPDVPDVLTPSNGDSDHDYGENINRNVGNTRLSVVLQLNANQKGMLGLMSKYCCIVLISTFMFGMTIVFIGLTHVLSIEANEGLIAVYMFYIMMTFDCFININCVYFQYQCGDNDYIKMFGKMHKKILNYAQKVATRKLKQKCQLEMSK